MSKYVSNAINNTKLLKELQQLIDLAEELKKTASVLRCAMIREDQEDEEPKS